MTKLRLYRPSNGTEGDDFTRQFCERCIHDREWRQHSHSPCAINMAAMCFEVDEPGFPPEWRYGDDGEPTCTAFVLDPESVDPGPLVKMQHDAAIEALEAADEDEADHD